MRCSSPPRDSCRLAGALSTADLIRRLYSYSGGCSSIVFSVTIEHCIGECPAGIHTRNAIQTHKMPYRHTKCQAYCFKSLYETLVCIHRMVHSVKACAGCIAVLLLHTELLHTDFQMVSFPKSVWLHCWQPVPWDGPQQVVLQGFFCPGEGGMLFHLGGMFGAGKGCQLQSFTNLSLCNM